MSSHPSVQRGAVTGLLLAALVLLSRFSSGAGGEGEAASKIFLGRCGTARGVGALLSPERPFAGEALRVLFVSDRAVPGASLRGKGPSGELSLSPLARGGPPYFWLVQVKRPEPGRHRFVLLDGKGQAAGCRRARVEVRRPPAPAEGHELWPLRRSWSRITENLYAAWIEKLFDAEPTERPSWTPLHQVLHDPERNVLYNHLGDSEDGPDARRAVVVKPDCADLPFFLRAYFAWKLRLPFGYRHCDRGSSRRAARCGELRTPRSEGALGPRSQSLAERFSRFLRLHVSYVHSGLGRTAPEDDETDLYPVRLDRASLRPGTVYVDPYGHLLVVARWINQTDSASGQLFAVDGHPDLSVGRKRFWRGAFLFSDKVQGGAGGLKAFRPLRRKGDQVLALTNEEIRSSPDYGLYSDQQYRLGIDGFYERMDRIINPRPLGPLAAFGERLKALFELVLERVDSVAAGEDYMKKVGYKEMPMPRGPRIFETSGPWEDFSTPARDFRLLIAMDEVAGFPDRVVKDPSRFALPAGSSPKAEHVRMLAELKAFAKARTFSYVKSDGSSQTLTLAELLRRTRGLEVAYNPNDCVELRWAATGRELDTCRRRAPEDQRKLMEKYRTWFATRDRPPIR